MVVSVKGQCPLCGEVHDIPDARSMDSEQMGCNIARETKVCDENVAESVDAFDEAAKAASDRRAAEVGISNSKLLDQALRDPTTSRNFDRSK